jgi:mannose-6-phosphate isomerase-like protein (cupin superfamily)
VGDIENRRVLVGVDSQGRSTIASDEYDLARNEFPNGILMQEIWWQPHIPAVPDDSGARIGSIGIAPPDGGAVVRFLTVPPSSAGDDWVPDLHFDDALHVITLTSGELDIILEVGKVTLRPGDSIILPGSVHDLRNSTEEPASFVYTSFPLAR